MAYNSLFPEYAIHEVLFSVLYQFIHICKNTYFAGNADRMNKIHCIAYFPQVISPLATLAPSSSETGIASLG